MIGLRKLTREEEELRAEALAQRAANDAREAERLRAEAGKPLKAIGSGRDAQSPCSIDIIFNRPATDDEMRALHDFLRRPPATCPFCSKPTYACPCTNCGEPDRSEEF